MQFLFCLILLSSIFVDYSLTINDNDLIQCTSRCQRFTVSFSEPLLFPPYCQDNNDNSSNYYDYGFACGIEYTLNYNTREIQIEFLASNDTGSLEDQKPADFLVQTIQLSLSDTSNQQTTVYRKYACNTGNDCARKFYIDSINYLINEGQNRLDSLKTKLHNDSLITGPTARRRCIDSRITGPKPSIKCPQGNCYVSINTYQSDTQEDEKTQDCRYNESPTLFSEIEKHTPASGKKERENLKYACNKNVCNRDDFVKRVRDLIGEVTNGNSNIEKIVNEKTSSFSIRQTMSSMNLVLFFCLFQLFNWI